LLCGQPDYNGGPYRGETQGWLGKHYSPVVISKQDYNSPSFRVSNLDLASGTTPALLHQRQGLLRSLDGSIDAAVRRSGLDAHRQNAFDLLTSPRVRSAFDLEAESPKMRDHYGRHSFGQAVLLARRLIEQEVGVSCVTVHWTTTATSTKYLPIWDT